MAVGPIEPAAITAATLLASNALEGVGGKAGQSTWAGMVSLAELVRGKLVGHRNGEAALAAVDARPADPAAVHALARALSGLAADDPAFRAKLVELVELVKQDPTIGTFTTHVDGLARIGQVINLAQVQGDVHFHPPIPATLPPFQHPEAGEARWPAPERPIANLPARNRVFTGRIDLLDQLHQQLTTQPAVAVAVTAPADDAQAPPQADAVGAGRTVPRVLHGLGGVGKTELAAEYAHRHASEYDIRWWIPAEQPAAIAARLVSLAGRLGIPEQVEQAETISRLLGELARHGRWLLVFDNAEGAHELRPYWPSTEGGGHVLITSRNPYWQPLAAPVPVEVLPRADAIAFLERRISIDKQDADKLAEVLGDLPLALEQAAAYLDQTHTPPDEYLELLAGRARELFTLGRPTTSEQTIATIWTVSLQRLRDEEPAAEDLLRLCAFLAPDDIPHHLLSDHPNALPEPLATVVRDRLSYAQARAALGRYSLATVTGKVISVHRLVQAVVRNELTSDQERRWKLAALRLVAAAQPAEANDQANWLPQWPGGLKDFIKELPPLARTFAVLALVSTTFAVLWSVNTARATAVMLRWTVATAFAVVAVGFLLLAGYYSVRRRVEQVAENIETLQVIEPAPPAFHVGCRIGRRRLECGVLEVVKPTSGVPASPDDVRRWGDSPTLGGPLSDGALLSGADQGLFQHTDLYRELVASIAALFQAAQPRGVPIASIGIAIPGGVHPDTGTFDAVVGGVPFKAGEDITWEVATRLLQQVGAQTLDELFGTSDPHAMRAKIHLDNDARCAARWLLVENGPSWKDFVCIFAGSGLGSGLVFNREVFYGHHFRAGEVGHVNLNLSSELLLDGTGGKSLKARHCSCGKQGYHFESLVSIGGLGHLAEVFDKDKLTRLRDAYTADPSRSGHLASSSIDDADADGMVVLRALASAAQPVEMSAALRNFVADVLPDQAFLDLIRSKPIHDYLTLVAKQYARLFGAGIAALLDALDVDHIALCGTIPEFLQYNREFVTALYASLPENIPGTPRAVSLQYGGMRRWGWRGAALLPRDPGYMRRRR